MEAAKAAVKDFMHKSGHHDTTVHEKVAPAMTHETITRTQHENVQTAVDKEVHQDHYHTSVQPVHDKERLAETHHHNVLPVEHRSFEHDNNDSVKRKLAEEQSKFRDEQTRVKGEHTSSVQPVVAGEHVHHHVHETIQPIVNKQTIEPHVVHTTVPVHEVHHNAAQHHSTSALPAVSMSEFKKQGGVLSGREERYDGFEGEPRNIGGAFGSTKERTTTTGTSGLNDRTTGTTGLNDRTTGTTGLNDRTTGTTGLNDRTTGTTGLNERTEARGNLTNSSTTGTAGAAGLSSTGTTHTKEKASLMDKMNPKKDADRDGKAGFMD